MSEYFIYPRILESNISEHFLPEPALSITTKAIPQHRELHVLLLTLRVRVLIRPLLNHNIEDAGDGAYGL